MKGILFCCITALGIYCPTYSQNVGVGTATPDGSARLEVNAPDKGLLIPRISLTNVSTAAPITSPAIGLLVFNTNASITGGSGIGFYHWDGAQWQGILSDSKGWKLSGNGGTNPSTQFIGTSDNQPLALRVNNIAAGKIDFGLDNVFIGIKAGLNNAPSSQFDGRWNTFVGDSAGMSNTNGFSNCYFGKDAGFAGTTAAANSFFGYQAGRLSTSSANSFFGYTSGTSNTSGSANSYYGYFSGQLTTTGGENCYFGASAGRANTSGNENAGFGRMAGFLNSIGNFNSYFGGHAGHNSTGNENTLIGDSAAVLTTSGNQNTALGRLAGNTNVTGSQDLFVGYNADASANNLVNATAIGTNAFVGASNSMVLGSINGVNGATTDMKVGIGITSPLYRLHVVNSKTNDGGFQSGIVVENTSPIATVGEAAISFKNASINNNYWIIGINQSLPWLAFNYGTTFAGSTTKVVIDTLGNVGIGNTAPTQKLDVTGVVRVSGEILRTSTGGANVVPICYGNVTSTGSIDSGTPNFSVTHTNGTGLYTITITGESYSFISYSTVVTSIGLSPVIIATFSSAGSLQVRLFNTSNSSVDSDFNFVVYKN
jgi:hypothetical protein